MEHCSTLCPRPRLNPRNAYDQSLTSLDQGVGREQFERVHLVQDRMEKQGPGRRPLLEVGGQTLPDQVLLQRVVQRLDGPVDVVLRDQRAAVAVPLYFQGRHFQRAHAERVHVDGGRHEV